MRKKVFCDAALCLLPPRTLVGSLGGFAWGCNIGTCFARVFPAFFKRPCQAFKHGLDTEATIPSIMADA